MSRSALLVLLLLLVRAPLARVGHATPGELAWRARPPASDSPVICPATGADLLASLACGSSDPSPVPDPAPPPEVTEPREPVARRMVPTLLYGDLPSPPDLLPYDALAPPDRAR